MKYKKFVWITLFIWACSPKKDGRELAAAYIESRNMVGDHTIDTQLDTLLPGTNCILKNFGSKYFATEKNYNEADTNQILLIPFRTKNVKGNSSGFSDLNNRVVFICPIQIKTFVHDNSLSDSSGIAGYLGLILLHEAGHFIYNIPGNFDEDSVRDQTSTLGQQDMDTDPVLMTIYKKQELKVDSTAIEMITKATPVTKNGCFSACLNIELAIGGAEFMQFGKRLMSQFGQRNKTIKDVAWSHPNIELRLAFMNYYLHPTAEKRQQIDDYLYNREMAPVNRQLTDPRIFQGNEKVLPGELK